MDVWVESGGVKPGCAKPDPRFGKAGADGWPTVSVKDVLANPHAAIKRGTCPNTLAGVKAWLKKKDAAKFNFVVRSCMVVGKKHPGKPLRITCAYGKHRSAAIAEEVAKKLGRIVAHRDRA